MAHWHLCMGSLFLMQWLIQCKDSIFVILMEFFVRLMIVQVAGLLVQKEDTLGCTLFLL